MPEDQKKTRILWVSRYCLADTSSGASMAVREMLLQLGSRGFEIAIAGATVFDSAIGKAGIQEHLNTVSRIISLPDESLFHNLVRTESHQSKRMILRELNTLFSLYTRMLEEFEPDLVWFYGGNSFDYLFPSEAKRRGIRTAAYLGNGNYKSKLWSRDVDTILTDSRATADLYARRLDLDVTPVGTFIRPERYIAPEHRREYVTFVNPVMSKGAGLVVQLALALEEKRPDIRFEIVESRGRWAETLSRVSKVLGTPRDALRNVRVTGHTDDMRPVYARSRLVLMPSLGWESAGRVLAEAALNGIPGIVTNRGGPPEMIGEGGVTVSLPDAMHQPPYTRLLAQDGVEAITGIIERLFDDEAAYRNLASKALRVGQQKHSIARNTEKLIPALLGG